jgi:hypothetical protein
MKISKSYRQIFMELVNDLSRELSYPENSEPLREDNVLVMEMSLEDIPFNVSHFMENQPEKILIEAVFGDVPPENATDILYRILHLNRELSESGMASIGYDSIRAKVVYSLALKIDSLSGESILEKMTETAWRAKYWRKTHFLQDSNLESNGLSLKGQFTTLA